MCKMIKYIENGEKILVINNRIKEICSIIDKTDTLIDVGTDHAYLPIYCLKNKIVKNVVISDIKSGPMKTAMKNIKKHDCEEQVTTFITDDLNGIDIAKDATIVIAGMGGETIIEILAAAGSKISCRNTLIMQPATAPRAERGWG